MGKFVLEINDEQHEVDFNVVHDKLIPENIPTIDIEIEHCPGVALHLAGEEKIKSVIRENVTKNIYCSILYICPQCFRETDWRMRCSCYAKELL